MKIAVILWLACMPSVFAGELRYTEIQAWGDPPYLDVAYGDDRIYALASHELTVFDVRNPELPVKIASLVLCDEVEYTLLRDHLLLVVHRSAITLIDVGDPANPVILSTIQNETGASFTDIDARGSTMAWLDGLSLKVFNISNADAPVLKHHLPYRVEGLALGVDTILYSVFQYDHVTDNDRRILYLADPSGNNLQDLEQIDFPQKVNRILIHANFAYVLADGLHVFDLSAGTLNKVGFMDWYPPVDAIEYNEGALYLESGGNIQHIDVTDPAHPQRVGFFPALNKSFAISGNILFAAEDRLNVYDITLRPDLLWLNQDDGQLAGTAHDLHIRGDHLFVAHDVGGLRVLDIAADGTLSPNRFISISL